MANAVRTVAEDIQDGPDAATTRMAALGGQYSRFRRAHIAATEPKWQKEVLAKVTGLLALRPGWDSYDALAPRYDAAMFALTILQNFMRINTPAPSIVPSHGGGIQLEWHERGIDLEIHVVEPYKGDVWWRDQVSGHETSVDLGPDLSMLRVPIDRISDAI